MKKETKSSIGRQESKSETKSETENRAAESAERASDTGSQEPPSQGPTMASVIKEAENAMFSIRFYPVAVNEQAKNEAINKLEQMYEKGSETVRQMLIYMIHETLATSVDLKIMHTFDYFKMKNPALDPAQQRMSVYRAIFNYNTSLEGLMELIRFLGRLRGSDDAAKLLTYHFSRFASMENEANHMLRAAILEALGNSESKYALMALLDYARYTDNERTFNRIVSALFVWEGKLDTLRLPAKEKDEIKKRLKEIVTSEFGGSHYG